MGGGKKRDERMLETVERKGLCVHYSPEELRGGATREINSHVSSHV